MGLVIHIGEGTVRAKQHRLVAARLTLPQDRIGDKDVGIGLGSDSTELVREFGLRIEIEHHLRSKEHLGTLVGCFPCLTGESVKPVLRIVDVINVGGER